jgi:MFS family permease
MAAKRRPMVNGKRWAPGSAPRMTSDVTAVEEPAEGAAAKAEAQPYPDQRKAWYGVGIFSVVLMFLVLDRGIITLLVQPIKRDLHLSDTEMSYLLGFAAVIFYAFVGVPISRFVDRTSRRALITAGIVFWSIMTALCGAAQNFWQLFIFRIGVGAGESFNGPATYSMMADMFPRERLPRAIAFLNVGFVVGTGVSLVAGGAVIHLLSGVPNFHVPVLGLVRNWQLVFFMVGLPGILVGALLMATVPEPARRGLRTASGKPPEIPLKRIVAYVIKNWHLYGPMFLGLAISSVETAGTANWRPAFFQRTYGWSAAQVGYVTGFTALALAPVGLFLGTWLSEYFAKKGRDDGNMRVVALVYTAGFPFAILGPLMPNPWLAVAFTGISGIVGMASAPSFNAALQLVTPNEMRGQVTALFLFIFTVVGSGFGPTFIALITDYVLPSEDLIRYAMAGSAAVMGPLAAWIIWRGVKPYGVAFNEAKAWG